MSRSCWVSGSSVASRLIKQGAEPVLLLIGSKRHILGSETNEGRVFGSGSDLAYGRLLLQKHQVLGFVSI